MDGITKMVRRDCDRFASSGHDVYLMWERDVLLSQIAKRCRQENESRGWWSAVAMLVFRQVIYESLHDTWVVALDAYSGSGGLSSNCHAESAVFRLVLYGAPCCTTKTASLLWCPGDLVVAVAENSLHVLRAKSADGCILFRYGCKWTATV